MTLLQILLQGAPTLFHLLRPGSASGQPSVQCSHNSMQATATDHRLRVSNDRCIKTRQRCSPAYQACIPVQVSQKATATIFYCQAKVMSLGAPVYAWLLWSARLAWLQPGSADSQQLSHIQRQPPRLPAAEHAAAQVTSMPAWPCLRADTPTSVLTDTVVQCSTQAMQAAPEAVADVLTAQISSLTLPGVSGAATCATSKCEGGSILQLVTGHSPQLQAGATPYGQVAPHQLLAVVLSQSPVHCLLVRLWYQCHSE